MLGFPLGEVPAIWPLHCLAEAGWMEEEALFSSQHSWPVCFEEAAGELGEGDLVEH